MLISILACSLGLLISILACSLGFQAITFERSTFTKINQASVALNPLASLFGRLVARSGRKRGNRQTDGRTDGRTDLQTKLYNPRCACAPRVNY